MTHFSFNIFASDFPLIKLKRGDTLLYDNDGQGYIYLLKSGFIQITYGSETEDEFHSLIFKANDIFSFQQWVLTNSTKYIFEALTNSEIYIIPKDNFQSLLETTPDALKELYLITSNILERAIDGISQIGIGDAQMKIATRLLNLAKYYGESMGIFTIIPIHFTHEDIARSIGITRETTTLQLKKLKNLGIVKYRGNFITINDSKLEKYCKRDNVKILSL